MLRKGDLKTLSQVLEFLVAAGPKEFQPDTCGELGEHIGKVRHSLRRFGTVGEQTNEIVLLAARLKLLEQVSRRCIRLEEAPPPVTDQRRVRAVASHRLPKRLEEGGEGGGFKRRGRVGRREPSRMKQLVLGCERQKQAVGEMKDHLPAGARPPGLEEGEMTR